MDEQRAGRAGAHTGAPARGDAWAVLGSLLLAFDLAVARPVLDLLARNPEFFTARRAPALDVIVVAVGLALLAPAALAGVVLAVRRALPRAGAVLHLALLAALAAALAVQLLERVLSWPVAAAAGAAVGVGVALAYHGASSVRAVVRWGSALPLLVIALFLAAAPLDAALGAPAAPGAGEVRVGEPAPVVVVVLDELPVTTLLDADGDIDASRFPGFARLAATSTWFRNAATPYDHTHRIIPALLTGRPWEEGRAPVAADHPDNLFTLLGDSHDVVARERVTWLCPPSVCPVPGDGLAVRLGGLASDVGVVASHVLLPEPLTASLPPLDGAWGGFAGGDDGEGSVTAAPEGAGDMSFAAFLDSFRGDAAQPLLRYYHLMAPHHPFRTLPDGSSYPQELPMPAYDRGPPDEDDEFYIAQAQQRHLLQTGAVDRLVSRLLDTLEAWPDYDDALVVVLGDHGVSFRAGQSLRLTRAGNVDEIAYVPLFVKAPGQRRGRVDERPALVTDLMATVVDALDLSGVAPEGKSLLADATDPRRGRSLLSLLGSSHPLPADGADRARALDQQTRRFGRGRGWDPVWRHGPHRDLVGAAVADLERGPPVTADVTFTDLDPSTPVGAPTAEGPSLPVLVDGRVRSDEVAAGDWLAVVVHGRVAATTLVHDREAGPSRFSAMVPPQAYAEGVVTPDLYRIAETGAGVRLQPLSPSAGAPPT